LCNYDYTLFPFFFPLCFALLCFAAAPQTHTLSLWVLLVYNVRLVFSITRGLVVVLTWWMENFFQSGSRKTERILLFVFFVLRTATQILKGFYLDSAIVGHLGSVKCPSVLSGWRRRNSFIWLIAMYVRKLCIKYRAFIYCDLCFERF
jgi:hypothetical protein